MCVKKNIYILLIILILLKINFLLSIDKSSRILNLYSLLIDKEEVRPKEKCPICGLDALERDSIEYLNCGHMMHISCVSKICKKFGTDYFFFNCFKCTCPTD